MELIHSDNQLAFAFDFEKDAGFITVKDLTRKDADGNQKPTGQRQLEYLFRKTKAQIDNGEGIKVANPDGTVDVYSEIKFVGKRYDEAAIKEKREASRWSNFGKDFRRFAGLSKSAKAVDQADKLTTQDVANFCNGFRKVKGYFFADLPQSAQDAVTKAYADLLKKEREAKPKVPSMEQLLELAVLAKQNGTELGDDWLQAVEQVKARASKMKAGKAAKAAPAATASEEVELTEQGID